jgi:hypothetical protein
MDWTSLSLDETISLADDFVRNFVVFAEDDGMGRADVDAGNRQSAPGDFDGRVQDLPSRHPNRQMQAVATAYRAANSQNRNRSGEEGFPNHSPRHKEQGVYLS